MVEAKDLIDRTLCWGTLKPKDLCDMFLPTCKALGADVLGSDGLEKYMLGHFGEEVYWTELWEEIFEALNDIAPEGTYFGGHVGDPSDIGFWTLESEDENE